MNSQTKPAPCTASIENDHTHGRQHCTRPAGHTDSHASPPIAGEGIAGQAGRIYWDDAYVGAVPHQPAAVSAAVAPPTQAALRDRIEVWPLARVLKEVRCGSEDWSWEEEWADLDQRHADTGYLDSLEQQIRERGITMPVLIGSDGRLWDGHHRLRIAVRLGIPYVPVELTPPADAVLAVLPEPADRAAILADVERAIRTATGSCGYKAEDGCDFCNGVDAALDQVRRMADETATQTPSMRLARQSVQAMTDTLQQACPPGCVACATDESHDPGPAAGARQDGAES